MVYWLTHKINSNQKFFHYTLKHFRIRAYILRGLNNKTYIYKYEQSGTFVPHKKACDGLGAFSRSHCSGAIKNVALINLN